MCIYIYIYIYNIYILTLSAFCISVKYTLIIQQDIIFKTVIFLRIFNGLLQIKSVKKYILT